MCVYLYTQLIYTVHIYIMHTKNIILECDLITINHCLALIIILYYIILYYIILYYIILYYIILGLLWSYFLHVKLLQCKIKEKVFWKYLLQIKNNIQVY